MKISIVLLTGAMRSGTSVLGKIIGSMQKVEFFYEPALFARILIDPSLNRLLKDYIREDLVIPSLAGRSLNLNYNDDSSIFNYKTKKFIDSRLSRSWTTDRIFEENPEVTCLIKYPTYVSHIASLTLAEHTIKKVLIFRKPDGNVSSLMMKRWFSDEVIEKGISGEFKKFNGHNIPMWLEDHEFDIFKNLDEQGRCLYYYNKVNKFDVKKYDLVIAYEALCSTPRLVINNIEKKLNLVQGDKTQELISSLRKDEKSIDIKANNKAIYELAMHNYECIKKLCNE